MVRQLGKYKTGNYISEYTKLGQYKTVNTNRKYNLENTNRNNDDRKLRKIQVREVQIGKIESRNTNRKIKIGQYNSEYTSRKIYPGKE